MTPHGGIHWSELMTRDPDAAQRFFESVVGWTVSAVPMPGGAPYRLCMVGGQPVAGIFDCTGPEFEGIPANWTTYIAVDDVDAACERTTAGGGRIQRPCFDVPGVGRIAIIADPTGAVVGLITPAPPSEQMG